VIGDRRLAFDGRIQQGSIFRHRALISGVAISDDRLRSWAERIVFRHFDQAQPDSYPPGAVAAVPGGPCGTPTSTSETTSNPPTNANGIAVRLACGGGRNLAEL
jgi:hypothetical protein